MPPRAAPRRCAGRPVAIRVPEGTVLYRVFNHTKRGPLDFNPTPAIANPDAGRFDSADGSYAYLYVTPQPEAALAEALLRRHRGPTRTDRLLAIADLTRYALAQLRLDEPITAVSLQGADVGHVCQDIWLTTCDSAEYSLTWGWAAAIRRWCPAAAGLRWRARKDVDRLSLVLFADRLGPAPLSVLHSGLFLDRGTGLALTTAVLQRHNVTVA